MVPAIFLDRDGVLNRERRDYVRDWSQLEFLPGALDAVRALTALALPLIIVTNQSVIGRGLASAAAVVEIHERMREAIERAGGRIDALYCCPHHPAEGCACRKPRPGMLLQAAREHGLDLPRSLFIGDSYTDHLAAQAAGCRSLLVRSGRQGATLASRLGHTAVPLLADLAAAARWIPTQSFPFEPSAGALPGSSSVGRVERQ